MSKTLSRGAPSIVAILVAANLLAGCELFVDPERAYEMDKDIRQKVFNEEDTNRGD